MKKVKVDAVLGGFRQSGVPLDPLELARALRDEAGLSVEQIARVLYDLDELTRGEHDVAHALFGVYGLNLDADEVASVLHSDDGLHLDEYRTASALHGLGLSAEGVARALYLGARIEKPEIARVLGSPAGLGLHTTEVVGVLHKAFGLSAEEVAEALVAAR